MMRFAKTHEWARLEDGVVTVGISDFAVEELGDVVFLDLPKVGTAVTAGEPFGEIESVKAAAELFAPVDGEVIAANTDLEDDFDTLKEDPYGRAWMVRIRASDPAQVEALLTEAQYRALVAK